jgi:hypothetical protein
MIICDGLGREKEVEGYCRFVFKSGKIEVGN